MPFPIRKFALALSFLNCFYICQIDAKEKEPETASPEFVQVEDRSKAMMYTPRESHWMPAPASLPAGAEMLVLEGNPESPGPFTMRLKFPPHYQIPTHWHFSDEHITLISGTLTLGLENNSDVKKGKLLSMGSYARIPAKMSYAAWTNEEETIIQLHGIGPWGFNYNNTNYTEEPEK